MAKSGYKEIKGKRSLFGKFVLLSFMKPDALTLSSRRFLSENL